MNIALWAVAGLLALAMLASGAMKLTGERAAMIAKTPYVQDFPQGVIRLSGAAEVLGALGLVLPALLGVATVLVPVAATGLALIMVGAAVVHVRRGDGLQAALPSLVLAALAVLVAWGRFGPFAF